MSGRWQVATCVIACVAMGVWVAGIVRLVRDGSVVACNRYGWVSTALVGIGFATLIAGHLLS